MRHWDEFHAADAYHNKSTPAKDDVCQLGFANYFSMLYHQLGGEASARLHSTKSRAHRDLLPADQEVDDVVNSHANTPYDPVMCATLRPLPESGTSDLLCEEPSLCSSQLARLWRASVESTYSSIGDYQQRLCVKYTDKAYMSPVIHMTSGPEVDGRTTFFAPEEREMDRGSWIVQNRNNGAGRYKERHSESAKASIKVPFS